MASLPSPSPWLAPCRRAQRSNPRRVGWRSSWHRDRQLASVRPQPSPHHASFAQDNPITATWQSEPDTSCFAPSTLMMQTCRPHSGGRRPLRAFAPPSTYSRATRSRTSASLLSLRASSIGLIARATPLHPPGAPEVDASRQPERRDRALSNSVARPGQAAVPDEAVGVCSRSCRPPPAKPSDAARTPQRAERQSATPTSRC